MKISLDLRGHKDIMDAIRTLEPKLRSGAFRKVFRELGKIAQKEVISNAPVRTGVLKRSVKVRAVKRNRRGIVGVNIVTGAVTFRGKDFYGGFVEYGTKGRQTSKGMVGGIRPQRFMRRAFESKVGEMESKGLLMLRAEIEKAIVKQGGGK